MKKQKQGQKRKSRIILYLLAGILFLSGFLVLMYPKFTDYQYQKDVANTKQIFMQRMESSQNSDSETDDLTEKLYQELVRRNTELYEERQKNLIDPFSYEQPNIDLSQYGISDNIIGFLKIDRMGIELPIYLGANQKNMSMGAVHLTETSYPVGGNNTNCVIAAHRGYSRTAMFRDIEELRLGDEIEIQNFREKLIYRVAEIRVISPTDINELLIQPGRDLVTLITCHPYRHNYQRYVVFCERVTTENQTDNSTGEKSAVQTDNIAQ